MAIVDAPAQMVPFGKLRINSRLTMSGEKLVAASPMTASSLTQVKDLGQTRLL